MNVPIQNPSFEQLSSAAVTTDACYSWLRARSGYPNEIPPNWQWTYRDPVWGIVAALQPLASNPCNVPAPPSGAWMLYLSGSTLSNELSAKPSDLQQPGVGESIGLYVMKFWVANYNTVYPGYYEAQILFGNHELCSIDGWATQHFTEITLMGLSPDYLLGQWPDGSAVDPNAHLIISLTHSNGWPLLFDNVSLTFTPVN